MHNKEENQRQPRQKTPEQALLSLCATCSKMERCVSDARRSLYRWEIAPTEQANIIEKLIDEGFIDERRYAATYVRTKVSGGRWGINKIISVLRAKQISEDIIRESMANNADKGSLFRRLEEQLVRKAEKERPKAKNGYDLRVRLFRFAASRGFMSNEINDILNKILKDDAI